MKCPNCGELIKEKKKMNFCGFCGANLKTGEKTFTQPEPEENFVPNSTPVQNLSEFNPGKSSAAVNTPPFQHVPLPHPPFEQSLHPVPQVHPVTFGIQHAYHTFQNQHQANQFQQPGVHQNACRFQQVPFQHVPLPQVFQQVFQQVPLPQIECPQLEQVPCEQFAALLQVQVLEQ